MKEYNSVQHAADLCCRLLFTPHTAHRDVARSVICVSVFLYVLGTGVSCTQTAEPIEMPFGQQTRVSPRNHIFDGIQIPQGKGHF